MTQYQGTTQSEETELKIVRVQNALRRSVNHQPHGLTIPQADRLSDYDLLSIKGIGRDSLQLIRRLARLHKQEEGRADAELKYADVAILLAYIESELHNKSRPQEDPNPDYLYALRQAIACLKDLKKFL